MNENEMLCKTNGIYEIWESEFDELTQSYYPTKKLRNATTDEIPKTKDEIIEELKARLDLIDGGE